MGNASYIQGWLCADIQITWLAIWYPHGLQLTNIEAILLFCFPEQIWLTGSKWADQVNEILNLLVPGLKYFYEFVKRPLTLLETFYSKSAIKR